MIKKIIDRTKNKKIGKFVYLCFSVFFNGKAIENVLLRTFRSSAFLRRTFWGWNQTGQHYFYFIFVVWLLFFRYMSEISIYAGNLGIASLSFFILTRCAKISKEKRWDMFIKVGSEKIKKMNFPLLLFLNLYLTWRHGKRHFRRFGSIHRVRSLLQFLKTFQKKKIKKQNQRKSHPAKNITGNYRGKKKGIE